MSVKQSRRKAPRPVAALWLLAGALVGFAPMETTPSPAGAGTVPGSRICEFSLQLQNSPQVRKMYIAKVAEITGRRDVDEGPVDAMYGDLRMAAASSDEGPDLWGINPGIGSRGAGLDSMSRGCLGCHDGVGAVAIATDIRNDPFRRGSRVNSFRSDHPVGMEYSRYAAANPGYKQVIPGTTKMLFVDGKVGCLTCHDPFNPERGHLVMSDRNSALCRTCHNK